MGRFLCWLFLMLAASAIAAEVPRHISGPARIVDGDGLKIGQWEIRLFGIDAPEMRSGPEGRRSRTALEDLIGSRRVDCDGLNFDRYGRVVAICRVDGKDIGEEMLAIGQAVMTLPTWRLSVTRAMPSVGSGTNPNEHRTYPGNGDDRLKRGQAAH